MRRFVLHLFLACCFASCARNEGKSIEPARKPTVKLARHPEEFHPIKTWVPHLRREVPFPYSDRISIERYLVKLWGAEVLGSLNKLRRVSDHPSMQAGEKGYSLMRILTEFDEILQRETNGKLNIRFLAKWSLETNNPKLFVTAPADTELIIREKFQAQVPFREGHFTIASTIILLEQEFIDRGISCELTEYGYRVWLNKIMGSCYY